MSDAGTVRCEIGGNVARLVVSNPARLNAFTLGMVRELDAAVAAIEASGRVRVVLVAAAPARCFCAGADIRDWGRLGPDAMGRRWIREGVRAFSRLARLDAVVICLIGGDAYGGGLELALSADIRLAADSIHVGFPEVGIGAVPAWLGCARLVELAGPGRARQMILTGERVPAAKAEAWGILNEILPAGRLEARAAELAELVLSRSPLAIGVSKRLLDLASQAERYAGMHEFAASVCKADADASEGVDAFLEKRAPSFPDHPL